MKRFCRVGVGSVLLVGLLLFAVPFPSLADELTVYAYRDTASAAGKPGMWAVMLRFNNPVFPSNVAQSTKVTVDGVEKKFELLDRHSREQASGAATNFLLVPADTPRKAGTVKITVSKGLSDVTGRRLLAKDFQYEFLSLEKISIGSISTFYKSGKEKGLVLNLSGHVSEDDLSNAIEVDPAVEDLALTREHGWTYRITGNFEYNRQYALKIEPNTVSNGTAILEKREYPFKGPGIKPEISFKTRRSVVELRSRQLLPISLSNVTKVRCKVTRVPAYLFSDVSEAIRTPEGAKKFNLEEKTGELKGSADVGRVSPFFSLQTGEDSEVFFAQEGKENVLQYSLPLSFRKKPENGGAWLVSLSDPDKRAEGEVQRLVQITDLAVSYKQSADSLVVWVTSIYAGQPVAGAEVLLCKEAGQRYFAGKTDKDGLLRVKTGDKFPSSAAGKSSSGPVGAPIDISGIKWVVAATESDSCGLELNTLQLKPFGVPQTSNVDQKPESKPNGYVFTERGVYKPGETAHFKFVSRAYQKNGIVSPVGERVKVEIVGPTNDVNYSKELTLGEFGSCYDSLQIKKFFPVGTYTINVKAQKTNGIEQTFSNTFQVQEFKRIRHYATLSIKREEAPSTAYIGLKRTEEFLAVDVQGLYYTGGPVKNGRVRWKATLVPVVNTVKGLDGYTFGNEDDTTRFLESGEALLDSQGRLRLSLPLDSRQLTGINGVEISATVLDIDGEPATEVQTYNPKQRLMVGITGHPRQVQTGYSSALKVIVVDAEGKKVPSGALSASILHKEYFDVQKRDDDGNVNYVWEEGWKKTLSSNQPISNGEAVFQAEFNEGGDYLIAFTYEDKGHKFTSQTLFKVGWEEYTQWLGRQGDRGAATRNEFLLSMSKKEYAVGDTVKVEFNTPRPVRKCLVTLEKGKVLDAKVLDINGAAGSYEFVLKEEALPNVYVSVLAAAPREGFPVYASQADNDSPAVYFGYADVSVRSEVQKLRLEIEPAAAELKGRPAEQKSLSFRVTDHNGKGVVAEMAVCVVDEAVLALTGYRTPDLSSLARFNLPLSVFSGDLRLDLVSQDLFRFFSTKPLTGGGMGLGEVNPSLRKEFRPVAYFNPALVTDQSGKATAEFNLPDTTTAYRVFAVVCDKGSGFVSGQRNMVVTKEFFLDPSLPRFFCPGDSAMFPVVLHNKTAAKGLATVGVKGTGDLKVSLAESSTSIEPWSTSVIKAKTEITGGAEKAVYLFSGKFDGEAGKFDDAVELSLPVHSRFLPVTRVTIGDFTQKTHIAVVLPEELKHLDPRDVNPEDFKAHLVLSTTNWAKIAPGLRYMLTYPYGCIEQTSSGVIPLAGLRSLVTAGTIPGIKIEEVDKFLKQGVERLLSMQLASGGFVYWPGQLETTWWGSMYAVYALTLAREAGFEVPEERLDKALGFLREGLFTKEGPDRYHGSTWTKEYALFNLAMNKKLTSQELEPFFREYDSLTWQGKSLLLLAAKKTGYLPQPKLAEMVQKLSPKLQPAHFDYNNSSYRELAMCLLAAVDTGSAAANADAWAGELLRGLKPEGRWFSTADTGWCLFALSRYYQSKKWDKPARAVIKMHYAGENPSDISVSDASASVEIDPRKLLEKGRIDLESDSKTLVNYTLTVIYPDLVNDPAKLSKGFSLRKKIENLNGKDEVRVGDVLRVTLEMGLVDPSAAKYYSGGFEYLALEDPVPAGLVPINSELKTEGVNKEEATGEGRSSGDYVDDFTPTFFEFRDDGVRVFKNRAWSGSYRYSYLARAVAEGDFWMRKSRISLMYDPNLFGRTPGRLFKVLPVDK